MNKIQYKISCIYTITNLVDGKIYVGYSTNFYKRKRKHLNTLVKNVHANQHLQNAYNLYGGNNFLIEILEEYEPEFLKSMENWWCNMLNSHNRDYGYNIEPTSPNGNITSSIETKAKQSKLAKERGTANGKKFALGHRHTEEFKKYMSKINSKPKSQETKDKIGLAHKGKIVSKETREKLSKVKKGKQSKKPLKVKQINLEGKTIKIWNSSKEIIDYFNVGIGSIRYACKNNSIWKGFKWEYAETYN